MAISFQQALGVRESALTLRADRATLLANNLANADTPNYKARDIDFHQLLKKRMQAGDHPMKSYATRPGHIGIIHKETGFGDRLYRVPSQPSIDGNTVEEHVEHAEFMKNNLEFQAAFTLLNSGFKGLRKAIKGE